MFHVKLGGMTEIAPENADETDEAPDPLAPDENAPYGYTVDRATGTRRPKKTAGRPKVSSGEDDSTPDLSGSPAPEALRSGPKLAREDDRAPARARVRAKRGRLRADRAPKEAPEVPPFRAGPIAKGMNKLYLKAGKIIRVFDPEVGNAIIECTRKESDDDVTVGEAWEEIAKVNPRIRAFLLKMISGGAWTQLFMAHAPIFLAFVMKPAVAKHIPFMNVAEAFLTDDDGQPSEEAEALGGLQAGDVEQMVGFANQMAAQMGMGGLDLGAMMRGMGGNTQRAPAPGDLGDSYPEEPDGR